MPAPGFLPIPKPTRPRRRSSAERRAADAELAIPKGDAIRLTDEGVLTWARALGCCEWCGRVGPTEPSHTRSRGAGGGDTYENVTALCRYCHDDHHRGHEPTADQLLATAERREWWGRTVAPMLAETLPCVLMYRRLLHPPVVRGRPHPAPAMLPSSSAPSPSTPDPRSTGSDAP